MVNPAFAQSIQNIFDPNNGSNSIYPIVINLTKIAFTTAFLFFFWGIAKFILAAGDEKKIDEGKRLMFWGVIALFVMTAIAGIITLFQDTLGIPGINNISIPS